MNFPRWSFGHKMMNACNRWTTIVCCWDLNGDLNLIKSPSCCTQVIHYVRLMWKTLLLNATKKKIKCRIFLHSCFSFFLSEWVMTDSWSIKVTVFTVLMSPSFFMWARRKGCFYNFFYLIAWINDLKEDFSWNIMKLVHDSK